MTARLREALRSTAAAAPTYPVYERALSTARRSRRRRTAAALAALVLVVLAGAALPVPLRPDATPAAGAPAALPDRIGLPPLGTLHATDRPAFGPASVIFSGQAGRLQGWDEDGGIGIVAAGSDDYRKISMGYEAPVGEKVVLSPDGRYVARPSGSAERPRIDVIDLVTRRVRQLAPAASGSVDTVPAAWSPDGTRLAVRDSVPTGPERADYRHVLSVVPLDGRAPVRLAELPSGPVAGWPVAFAPDGSRLAYQVGRSVTVAAADGGASTSFPLPDESWLAGKGAWTADGRLTVATRRAGTTTWSLRRVDPGTGRETGGPTLPAVAGVTAIQLLGWAPGGSAVVVAYRPEPLAPTRFDEPLDLDQRVAYGNVRAVRVLALDPGGAEPRTLMTAPEQVLAVDVADQVIASGRTRDAHPPGGVGGRFWYWTVLTTLLVAGVAVFRGRERLALWRDDRRVRRARRAGGG
ncbi:TolB family protein [Micromonospora sp. NPDC049366]|uniref:TolB family protein n=1 Tax=Micromonospora sp. NPDC049366 TaxID=3364271 RepID=UPI0037B68F2E